MGRKTKTIIIPPSDTNRDGGKTYMLTEASAVRAEKWAWRAYLALAGSGIEVPQDVVGAGVVGLALVGFNAFQRLSFSTLDPLLDEMMTCVAFLPSREKPDFTRGLGDGDVEEIETLLMLRREVMELHMGFTFAAALSKLAAAAPPRPSAAPDSKQTPTPTSPD